MRPLRLFAVLVLALSGCDQLTAPEKPVVIPGPQPIRPPIAAPREPEPSPEPKEAADAGAQKAEKRVPLGRLKLTLDVDAVVRVDGKPEGLPPLDLDLSPGKHTLEFAKGKTKKHLTVVIQDGETTHVRTSWSALR